MRTIYFRLLGCRGAHTCDVRFCSPNPNVRICSGSLKAINGKLLRVSKSCGANINVINALRNRLSPAVGSPPARAKRCLSSLGPILLESDFNSNMQTGGAAMSEGSVSTLNLIGQGHVSAQAVREQLQRVIGCSSFSSSKRYPRFLSFVVEKTLAGSADDLKERLIGMEVFDRSPDYDLAADPCVRVAAGEIRKRLAQYYVQTGRESELRIDLHAGSYIPAFYWPHPVESPAEHATEATTKPAVLPVSANPWTVRTASVDHRPPRYWVIFTIAVLLIVVVAARVFLSLHSSRSSSLNDFWKPVTENGPSAIVCVGGLDIPQEQNSPGGDQSFQQVRQSASKVGPNDADVLARVAGILGAKKRAFNVHLAEHTTLSDLHTQPAVLIGGMNNPWTNRILANARFRFLSDPAKGIDFITDSDHADRRDWSFNGAGPLKQVSHDFAIIARLVSPLTGQPAIVVAGIGPFGTIAASEFVSNPSYFEQFARQAPKGWQDRNVEIVIETDVVDARSGAPHLVTFDVR